MVLQKYEDLCGFNIEAYYLSNVAGVSLQEFIPNFRKFETMISRDDYLGVLFVFDNIEKNLWVYQEKEKKAKGIAKKIKKESKEKKLTKYVEKVFEKEKNYNISSYDVKRALDDMQAFRQLFKYQINEYPLYKQHYLLPEYEALQQEETVEEQAKEEASANLKKCANCGWILSADTTVCPKCGKSPRKKD
ncbi:MAG: zinc ribbon domain-containing protein [Promethearchaeia archaeon]